MDKFFAGFGKFVLYLLLLGVLVGGGWWVGSQFGTKPATKTMPGDQATGSSSLTPEFSPTPTSVPGQVVSAGLGNIEGVNFPKYTISVPGSWTVAKEHSEAQSPMDVLTITKGNYKLKIYQAATGGAMCQYPGDPAFEGPSSSFTTFVELTDSEGRLYRRSGSEALSNDGTRGFTLCHKSEYGWQQPTPFGHVSFTLPATYDETTLKQMDEMIASLKKL